jgi:hypothetical protein
MSDADSTPATATEDHDSGHGHAPAAEPLGPIDWTAWGYALAGAVIGVLVVLALFAARGG